MTVIRYANSGRRELTADVALAVDGPALFLQGTLAVLGLLAVLLMAERTIEPGGRSSPRPRSPWGAKPTAARPGSPVGPRSSR